MPQKVNVRVGKIVSVSLRILFVETDKELGIVFKRSYRDSRVQEEKLCAAGHGLASRPSVPYVRKPRLDRACRRIGHRIDSKYNVRIARFKFRRHS